MNLIPQLLAFDIETQKAILLDLHNKFASNRPEFSTWLGVKVKGDTEISLMFKYLGLAKSEAINIKNYRLSGNEFTLFTTFSNMSANGGKNTIEQEDGEAELKRLIRLYKISNQIK